jgi:hypothetical protein
MAADDAAPRQAIPTLSPFFYGKPIVKWIAAGIRYIDIQT